VSLRNRVTGEPLEDVTTLGSHTLIRALPSSEREAYGAAFHNPPIMLRAGDTIVNDDAGVPRIFADVRDAIKWVREFAEPSDRRAPSSSDRTSSSSSPGIIRSALV
jgi:hypothetical protein